MQAPALQLVSNSAFPSSAQGLFHLRWVYLQIKKVTVTLFPLRFKYDYFIPKACIWSKEQTNDLSLEHPQDFGGGQFFGKEKMADTPLLIAFFHS